MELFLQAIESSEGIHFNERGKSAQMVHPHPSENSSSPVLSFVQRPPQWCIVDKWFRMCIQCHDKRIKQLEAIVYNSEAEIVRDLVTEDTQDARAIATVDEQSQCATFRVKFINGSKGAWLHVGIHALGELAGKCLLKSPPIKVQTNRSKRPRDTKKKPVPVVTSLSPNVVPASGNFNGRKDRMLLIFGSNFHIWGNSPVVRFRFTPNNTYMEMRPPDLIWWNENLLECQLPECSHDIEVSVANFDLVYGEGRILKITDLGCKPMESVGVPPTVSSSMESVASVSEKLTNSHLSLEYISPEDMDIGGLEALVRVILFVQGVGEFLTAETQQGVETIPIQDVGVIIKLVNKATGIPLKVFQVSRDGQRFCRTMDIMTLTCKIQLEKSVDDQPLLLVVNLIKESGENEELLLDPTTKKSIFAQKLISVPDSEEQDQLQMEQSTSNAPELRCSGMIYSQAQSLSGMIRSCELNNLKVNIMKGVTKCEDTQELARWETMLAESMRHLRHHREALDRRQRDPPQASQEVKVEESASDSDEKDEDEDLLMKGEEDSPEKTIAVPQLPTDPGQRQGLVYWKFFNPGTRTFLELIAGKLQIIGSRRIQMLIESIPTNSKFINAALYVQKNEAFEMIENCVRCKENGIPNVFCVLPRRGREHDYPWITFRITCTSTAKHWKGSPFWIGAEFLLDPTIGNMIKVFSPPIHVQSKVKSSTDKAKFNIKLPDQLTKPNTPVPPSFPNLDMSNIQALSQSASSQLRQSQ